MTRTSVVIAIAARTLYPVMLVVSVWLLLRGHHEPGGGFIGGMVAVAATALRAVAAGAAAAERSLPFGALRLSAAGVMLALGSGAPGALRGEAFLTHQWITVPPPGGGLTLSTVLLFDAGVYLAVWGALGGIVIRVVGLDEGDDT